HILDAKYSNRKTVAETHMPVCATKYGLETRMYQIVDGVPQLTVPDSVTLLYSGESADYSPMFRSGTAGGIRHLLETTKPQLGYIGLDETDIGPLLGTLKRLLWRTISTY
ncbi:hypothetical protein ON072_20930, partial [Shewanella sp. K8]